MKTNLIYLIKSPLFSKHITTSLTGIPVEGFLLQSNHDLVENHRRSVRL